MLFFIFNISVPWHLICRMELMIYDENTEKEYVRLYRCYELSNRVDSMSVVLDIFF